MTQTTLKCCCWLKCCRASRLHCCLFTSRGLHNTATGQALLANTSESSSAAFTQTRQHNLAWHRHGGVSVLLSDRTLAETNTRTTMGPQTSRQQMPYIILELWKIQLEPLLNHHSLKDCIYGLSDIYIPNETLKWLIKTSHAYIWASLCSCLQI